MYRVALEMEFCIEHWIGVKFIHWGRYREQIHGRNGKINMWMSSGIIPGALEVSYLFLQQFHIHELHYREENISFIHRQTLKRAIFRLPVSTTAVYLLILNSGYYLIIEAAPNTVSCVRYKRLLAANG